MEPDAFPRLITIATLDKFLLMGNVFMWHIEWRVRLRVDMIFYFTLFFCSLYFGL